MKSAKDCPQKEIQAHITRTIAQADPVYREAMSQAGGDQGRAMTLLCNALAISIYNRSEAVRREVDYGVGLSHEMVKAVTDVLMFGFERTP